MKKLLVLLVLIFSVSLTGCSKSGELEDALNKMDKLDSFSSSISMLDVPLYGTMTMIIAYDDDLTYVQDAFENIGYSKIIDGKEYVYRQNQTGYLLLSDTPEDGEPLPKNQFINRFSSKDFKQNGDLWESTTNKVYVDDTEVDYMKDITILINDQGYIIEITYILVNADKDEISFVVEYTGFNGTTISVPEKVE